MMQRIPDTRPTIGVGANITRAGLTGPNLGLGVLVRGNGVQAVEWILEMYRETTSKA